MHETGTAGACFGQLHSVDLRGVGHQQVVVTSVEPHMNRDCSNTVLAAGAVGAAIIVASQQFWPSNVAPFKQNTFFENRCAH